MMQDRGSPAWKVHRLARVLARACIALAVLGLLYQAALYGMAPSRTGESYGSGDPSVLFWLAALLVLAGVTVMFGAVIAFVPRLRDTRLAVRLWLAAVLAPAAYYFLHPLVARIVG